MKQKRKVKSLIPQKKFTSKSLKTAGLVILGSALYLASITLLTTSVAFGANEAGYETFTGFNLKDFPIKDKAEVVYAARFATRDNFKLNNNNKIIDIFMNKDGVLYIIPKPVIVNPALNNTTINHQRNEVEEKVYGHVLGGDENKVHSNNITIIAGYKNKVNTGNDNAVILGGEKNTINQGEGAPSAIIGGTNNTIETGHKGNNVIIGGNNNKITENVSSSAILGGEKNTIESDNAIVGGSNVTISGTENVFAYSNSGNFTPKNPNSFFLNMQKGVGINMEASSSLNGLYVSGAVSLGFIDIRKPCNSNNNYGLEGQYDGCLVGCTTGGWRMLDLGEKCENVCNNAKNNLRVNIHCPTHEEDDDLVAPTDYKAFCDGPADKSNATQCGPLKSAMNNYKNVVFETKLIDSETSCPTDNPEDKCIFRCNPGYHLTGDINHPNDPSKKKCYADCYLPWDTNHSQPRVPTNTIITGYDGDAFCSNDNGKHDDCSKHKATLICYSGDWHIYQGNSRKSSDNKRHKYEHCQLSGYTCSQTIYNLTQGYIKETGDDELNPWNTAKWENDENRNYINKGNRGNYKLCVDREPSSKTTPEQDGELCIEKGNNPDYLHYQLVSCNEGYSTGVGYEYACKRKCKLGGVTIVHNGTGTFYKDNSPKCPSECEGKTFKCNDGTFMDGNSVADTGTYNKASCKTQGETCPGFNVSENTRSKYDHIVGTEAKTSRYEETCQKYSSSSNNKKCSTGDVTYKLTNCNQKYHTDNNEFCVQDGYWGNCNITLPSHASRDDSDEDPLEYYGETVYRKGGTHGHLWIGTWKTGSYVDRSKCKRSCTDSGYYKNKEKTKCIKNGKCSQTTPKKCEDGGDASNIRSDSYGNHYWDCLGDGGTQAKGCHFCAEGYDWDGTVCYHCEPGEYWNPDYRICEEPVTEEGRCHNHDSNNISWSGYTFNLLEEAFNDENIRCFGGEPYGGSSIYDNVGKIIGYTRTCLGSNYDFEHSDECHECEPGYTWNNDTCVKSNGEECVGTNCPNPNGDGDEDGECNNEGTIPSWNVDDSKFCVSGKIKLSSRNGPNNHMFTWTCDGIGGGNPSGECKKCEDGYILSGNECVTTDINITPIWDTPECGSASGGLYADSQIDIIRNNACSERSELNGNVSTNDTKFTRECKQGGDIKTCNATRMTCGNAAGVASSETPSKNLCKQSNLYGNVSSNTNNTEWQWRCGSSSTQFKCTAPRTTYECKGTPPGAYTIKSSSTPTGSDLNWSYKTGRSINQLGACEWSCKDSHYVRSGSTMDCKPATQAIPCGDAPSYSAPDHSTWIKSTIVQERDGEKRTPSKPTNTCITGSTSNIACSFKCDFPYECNAAGTGCILVDNRTCDNYGTYNLCNDGTEGTPDGSGNGYLYWKCGKKRCETCDSSKGYNYKDGICKKCNNCAKNGFPYCFPINFKSDCDESLYLTTE